jgi:hypothetical protein
LVAKIRKQIYLDHQQNELLKRYSRKLGVSEAEIIRQAILAQASRMSTIQSDRKAWEDEQGFIRSLIKQGKTLGKRTWKRDDLYDR